MGVEPPWGSLGNTVKQPSQFLLEAAARRHKAKGHKDLVWSAPQPEIALGQGDADVGL